MMIYEFHDGNFQFFTSSLGSTVTIFRVRIDTWPERRAREKHISGDYVRSSSKREIMQWLETHPDYPVVGAHLENAPSIEV